MDQTNDLARQIRQHVVQMTNQGKSSHVGSCLSIADIVAVLYGYTMSTYPSNPTDPRRDRFILSKGHAGAAVYAALAECGFFDVELLASHCADGSNLSGHISHIGVPGVEVSTGSLGHGLGVAAGMAHAMRRSGSKQRVFALLSDGECDEGSVWEAALFAAHTKLENLMAIVDYNKLQSLRTTSETIELEPFADKWRSFGWNVIEVNGHDHDELKSSFQSSSVSCPTIIIAHTIKGKGVSFMENSVLWHYRSPQGDEYDRALKELAES